ncbi:hypothetical protein VNO77_03614 [Canavalia gladiata]|uniref:Uncharacterized protein n=1 Tax=Canavalia gladiata TaxID=3824 RepID=A0AAN9MV17_CANGL
MAWWLIRLGRLKTAYVAREGCPDGSRLTWLERGLGGLVHIASAPSRMKAAFADTWRLVTFGSALELSLANSSSYMHISFRNSNRNADADPS